MSYESPTWSDLDRLLDRALDLDRGSRVALVEEVATENPELATELRALLAAMDAAGPLDDPVGNLLGTDLDLLPEHGGAEVAALGRRIGPYRIVEALGRGGMGRVFRAERADGAYEGEVAIKVLRWEAATATAVDRFRRERQLLAQLDHPGLARLVDGGVTEDGLPYLVMELVEGVPLDRYCDTHAIDVRGRVQLVRDVCRVVDHAHRSFVVHRDLKPSNVLVTSGGSVKLLDFGIAKIDTDDADLTVDAAPFTPSYAAPEQLDGGPITTATDVYALGVLLFELLTGVRPFETDEPTRAELTRRVASEDPPPPSAVSRRSPSAAALRGDLDAIALRALSRDPRGRYASAAELAGELDRWLGHRPVQARSGGAGYRLRRFVRRRRGWVAAGAAVLSTLAVGVGLAWSQARRADRQRDRALTEARRAAAVGEVMTELFGLVDPFSTAAAGTITARELLDRGSEEVRARLVGDTATLASALLAIGDGYRRIGAIPQARTELESAVAMARGIGDTLLLADALHRLGSVETLTPERAIELFGEALELRKAALPEPDHATGVLYGNLADQWLAMGDADRADSLNSLQKEILETVLPPGDRDRLQPLLVDARIARTRGRLAEAEAAYEAFLDLGARALDPRDELWPVTFNNLGYVRRLQRKWAEAETAYTDALDFLEATAGPAHPDAVRVRTNLANVYATLGRVDEAAEALRRNVDLIRANAPDDHLALDVALTNLTGGYITWSDWPGAMATAREALAAWREADAPNGASVALHEIRLALALELSGAEVEAERLLAEARRSLVDLAQGGGLNTAAITQLGWIATQYGNHGRDDRAAELGALAEEIGRTP